MENVVFENRVVTFIDILGFKELVKQAVTEQASFAVLNDLVTSMEQVILEYGPGGNLDASMKEVIRCTYISDCWIISAPLYHNGNEVWGISALSQVVTELAFKFLAKGFLFSGGLQVGNVYHDPSGSNIVGPAYQDAYKLDSKNGRPLVRLSEEAVDKIKASPLLDLEGGRFIQVENEFYINSLWGSSKLADLSLSGSELQQTFSNIIDSQINELLEFPSALGKWKFFKEIIFPTMK